MPDVGANQSDGWVYITLPTPSTSSEPVRANQVPFNLSAGWFKESLKSWLYFIPVVGWEEWALS